MKKLLLVLFIGLSTLCATVKIMPLGDSITEGWDYTYPSPPYMHAYRNHLWYKLKNAGYDVNFVGTKNNGSAISPKFDGDHEGYKGYTTHQIAKLTYDKLKKTSPDIILLHIGTNDSMYYSRYDMTGLKKILDTIDRYESDTQKHITVIVARIIPLPQAGSWVDAFNSSLDSMVADRISNGDDIIKVNMNVIHSLIDGIHPTDSGYEQMADIWFNALKKPIEDRTNYGYLIPVYGLLLQ